MSTKIKKKYGLFLDTACPSGVVAVSNGQDILSEKFLTELSKHGEALPQAIDECLEQVGVNSDKLEFVCVGNGPGSFIGGRIAIAHAKGFCLGLSLKLFSVGTLQALANSIDEPISNGIVVTDARRGEFFVLEFSQGAAAYSPKVLKPEQVQDLCENKQIVVGYGFESKLKLIKQKSVILQGPTGKGLALALEQKLANNPKCPDEILTCVPNYCRKPDTKKPKPTLRDFSL